MTMLIGEMIICQLLAGYALYIYISVVPVAEVSKIGNL